MRRRTILRRSRVMRAVLGAMVLGAPASAALADSPPGSQADTSAEPSLEVHMRAHRIGFGRSVIVTGRAPTSDAGQPAALDFAPSATGGWRQLATSQISPEGSFRLSARLYGSGHIKVTTNAPSGTPAVFGASAATASATAPERVVVTAALRIRRRTHEVLGSGTFAVRGQLLPRTPGRRVVLQARRGGRWVTLATARTGSRGGFGLRSHLGLAGPEPLRVRFAGDRNNGSASAPAGRVIVLHQSLASWYDDGGTTACGFHAYYGVANLSLPCGARVTLRSGGRSVTATVDDRGPYVGGREWDLNQNTAAALGFGGVGAVWSSA